VASGPESINDLNEIKILGYFETIRSTFLIKLALILNLQDLKSREIMHGLLLRWASEINNTLPDETFMKAFAKLNPELIENLKEDAVSALVSGSWVVFEQIVKDLSKSDYATDAGDISANYQRGSFGFSKAEKDDLDFFYYLRNAMVHYNGAYYAYRDLDHTYNGITYKSVGHHGEKMEFTIYFAFQISADLEKYSMKAWTGSRMPRPAKLCSSPHNPQ